jgi:hypothetical protein
VALGVHSVQPFEQHEGVVAAQHDCDVLLGNGTRVDAAGVPPSRGRDVLRQVRGADLCKLRC